MPQETEIVITPSPRGYRFKLPEYCAPCPDAVRGLKQMSFLGYHKAEMGREAYRTFPADKLDKVVDFLNYWYVEPNPLMPTLNRNGGRLIAVRVVEAEDSQWAAIEGSMNETKPEIPMPMLEAATKAVCRVTARSDDFDHLAEAQIVAQAAFEAAGVLELLAECAKLKDALKWAMIEIGEGYCTEEDETPTHACEFTSNPEKGGCDYHEAFWDAMELLREKI